MGKMSEFPLSTQLFLKAYRWRRIDPVPCTPLRKPLSECRLGLVTSAGLSMPDQEKFDQSVKGGDPSYRVIASDVEASSLIENHRSESWDHRGVEQDRNLALPLDRARELVDRGRVASLNERNLSFMGSVTAPGRMMRDHLPEATRMFVEDAVDVTLLVPV